jgi:hypothetical protein
VGRPKYGSLMEVLLMLVWKKKQVIHAAQIRAMAQSALGGKEAEQAYKDFIEELTQVSPENNKDELRERLEDMKKIQAIKVTPLETATSRRKLRKVK